MNPMPLQLRMLQAGDEESFRSAVDEFARETPPWMFAFGFEQAPSFAAYIKQLHDQSQGINVPADFVPNTYLVGIVNGEVVGRVSIRHALNAELARTGGHVGYGVLPSHRRRGYATEMLRLAIPLCRARGIENAMITCDVDNLPSRKIIEKSGAVFENIVDNPSTGIPVRRYWLKINK